MVRYVKLILPYLQLAFIGWVVWTADTPEWQLVASIFTLAWVALGIAALRVLAAALTRGFLAHDETAHLLRKLHDHPGSTGVTKPRHRRHLP